MSSTPPGYKTIGPIIDHETTKEKFRDACKSDGITMENKLKEMILAFVKSKFPDYAPPENNQNAGEQKETIIS